MRYLLAFLCFASLGAWADVSVGGEVPKPLKLSSAELAALPHKTVKIKDKEYSGVQLSELMTRAGVMSPDEKHSQNIPFYVLVEAKDGYRAIFALVELDPLYTDKLVLLTNEGRLVVPDEKLPGRWVKDVVSLTVKKL